MGPESARSTSPAELSPKPQYGPRRTFRPTYREAKPALDKYVERAMAQQAGPDGHFKSVWMKLFLLSSEEAEKVPPEKTEELREVMQYIAKRLTWSTVMAPDHEERELDPKDLVSGFEEHVGRFSLRHDMMHALVALSFHPESNSLTPEFNRLNSYDLRVAPQVFEEELMASMFDRRLDHNEQENLWTDMARTGIEWKVRGPHEKGLGWNGKYPDRTDEEKKRLQEDFETKVKADRFTYFLEAYETDWFHNFKALNRRRLSIRGADSEEERKLFADMEAGYRHMQANRSPQYLELARNIYDACVADPDHKDPMILWREFERLAAPILKKVRQRGKNESMETN